jgi:uncharacterized protein YeaO (DUF488 family)
MARIRIKEGSTVIEVEDGGRIVFSRAFPGIPYATLEIETWEKGANPGSYKQGKLKKVAGVKNRATTT